MSLAHGVVVDQETPEQSAECTAEEKDKASAFWRVCIWKLLGEQHKSLAAQGCSCEEEEGTDVRKYEVRWRHQLKRSFAISVPTVSRLVKPAFPAKWKCVFPFFPVSFLVVSCFSPNSSRSKGSWATCTFASSCRPKWSVQSFASWFVSKILSCTNYMGNLLGVTSVGPSFCASPLHVTA